MITKLVPETWKDLQNEVADILEKCGFAVEIEKSVETVRGTVELDVYAEESINGRKYSIICECKHWKSNIPQNVIHGFRTVVADLGCNIGYVITTSDFQSGALKAVEFTNSKLLTWTDFQLTFLESWYEMYFSPKIAKDLDPLLSYVEPILPKWFHEMSEADKEHFIKLKEEYELFGWIVMSFTPYARSFGRNQLPKLPLREKIKITDEVLEKIPKNLLDETYYREFLMEATVFGNDAIKQFRVLRDKYFTPQN